MKREYTLLIILGIIIILAIVYYYLDKKDTVEGFDVKENQVKNTFSFVTPVLSTAASKKISDGKISNGYYRINDTDEMLLPKDYSTVSTPPSETYMANLPLGYYIGQLNNDPVLAKLPDNYDTVTIPPYKQEYITLSPNGNYTIDPSTIDLTDTNGNRTVTNGYYRVNETKQAKLPIKSTELTIAPDNNYSSQLPIGYSIVYLNNIKYVAKISNNITIPPGYYVTTYNNQTVLAKLPDYTVVLSLLPKVDSGYTMPEGYYIASKNNVDVLAKLPDKDDVLTLPPKEEVPPKLPMGYYIARYSTIKNKGDTASSPVKKLAKLPYGYTLPYKDNNVDSYGRYTVEPESREVTIGTDKITIIYDEYRPKPTTYATIQREIYKRTQDANDYIGNTIVDKLYEKDYTKTLYSSDSNNFPDYHETPEQLLTQISNSYNAGSSPSFASMTVIGPNGNMIEVPYINGQALPTYYQPGSYTYGTTYVPNYEDSVYLSKSTGLSTLGKTYPTSNIMGGFCNAKISMEELEKRCNAIPTEQCASTSCCVLLGGSKCVHGNELGPKLKANYTDKFIKNRDVYYYQGKCYGNCV